MARGSISKRNNGYVYRIDLGVDPTTGKRRQISRQGFKNKKGVERVLAEHLEQLRSGTHVDQSKMTTAVVGRPSWHARFAGRSGSVSILRHWLGSIDRFDDSDFPTSAARPHQIR